MRRASEVDVDVMGTMSMGGFGGGNDFGESFQGERPSDVSEMFGDSMPEDFGQGFGGEMPSDMNEMFGGGMPGDFDQGFGGEIPSDMSEMFGDGMPGDFTQMFPGGQSTESGSTPGIPGMGGMQAGSGILGNILTYGVCFVIAVAALIFAIKYKRK